MSSSPFRTPPPPRIRRILDLVLALSLLPGLFIGAVLWLGHPDDPGVNWTLLASRDFTNFWIAGGVALRGDPAPLFDPPQFAAVVQAAIGQAVITHTWSYPPSMLLLVTPLALLPPVASFLTWSVGTLGFLFAVLRMAGFTALASLLVVASPAAIENMWTGQNGALTAACLVGGLLLADRRPVMAGMLFGLLTLKPHLGLLVPVCLLASRNWRALAAACATALALAATSAALFGFHAWEAYLTVARANQTAILNAPPGAGEYQMIVTSLFMLLRWAGASLGQAYAGQAVAALASAAVTWRAWRQPDADPAPRMALTVALAFLTTPYAFSYDTVSLAAGLLVLVQAALRLGCGRAEALLLGCAWAWPGLALLLGPVLASSLERADMPSLAPLLLPPLALLAHRRFLRAEVESSAGTGSGAG